MSNDITHQNTRFHWSLLKSPGNLTLQYVALHCTFYSTIENCSACCTTSRGIKLAASQALLLRSACSLPIKQVSLYQEGLICLRFLARSWRQPPCFAEHQFTRLTGHFRVHVCFFLTASLGAQQCRTNYHHKNLALILTLKRRQTRTQKWPVGHRRNVRCLSSITN